MSAKFTSKGCEYILGTAFKGATPQTTFYIGFGTTLSSTLGDASTSISEPADATYARKPITATQFGAYAQNGAVTEIASNADIITNAWTANQSSALATVGIFSALTGGDLIAYSDILDAGGTPQTLIPVAGQAIRLPAGQIKLSLD